MSNDNPIIIAGMTCSEIESLLPFGRALAGPQGCGLIALGLVRVPLSESLSTGALNARFLRESLEPRLRAIEARLSIHVAHDVWRETQEAFLDEGGTLLLLHWQSRPPRDWLNSQSYDIVFVKPPFPKGRPRMLLPIRGGPYAALALRLALALADSQKGEITALHASPIAKRYGSYYASFLRHLNELPQVTRRVAAQGNAVKSIVDASRRHDLIIMGAVAKAPDGAPVLGSKAAEVLNKCRLPALVVKAASPIKAPVIPEPLKTQAPVDYTISVIVDKWFAENTFHSREYRDLKSLIELKEKQGLTISLGLPALNEEATIGKVIKTVRSQFVDSYPLLDEIVVIDSNSTDRTVEIARNLGVTVVKHPEVLTKYGSWRGKGEALWKSLYVLQSDLIAWIDTDIVNIHPRFIYGILGPLIHEPRLMYVKGFYQRPLREGRITDARGGGRVTELTARPLINLFYPELSGVVQPLAGEYAGRRQALERVPFFAGYGVEMGLLIDIWSRYGLEAIGQVDLEERIHRNQSLMSLSKMAFEIIQVVLQRVGEAKGQELVDELNKSMKLIRYDEGEFQLDVADIRARERLPMIMIPEYQVRRGRGGA